MDIGRDEEGNKVGRKEKHAPVYAPPLQKNGLQSAEYSRTDGCAKSQDQGVPQALEILPLEKPGVICVALKLRQKESDVSTGRQTKQDEGYNTRSRKK